MIIMFHNYCRETSFTHGRRLLFSLYKLFLESLKVSGATAFGIANRQNCIVCYEEFDSRPNVATVPCQNR